MRTQPSGNIVKLQSYPGGVGAGIRTALCKGRFEVVTNGPNPEFGFIGSDPYQTNAFTGLVVPTTPTSQLGGRYLMVLARARFGSGEAGVRLVGIRQYAEVIARITAGNSPLTTPPPGPPTGSTVTFRREILSPLWHPPDGNISWHVMVQNRVSRDSRNPANADGVVFQDSTSPSLLYQTIAGPLFAPTTYTPPNGGRPWGVPIAASLGNIHEMRYDWRTDQSEHPLDILVPVPCDVVLVVSVRQNDPATNPSLLNATTLEQQQWAALCREDRFLTAYSLYAQYGGLAGALTFEENLGEEKP